MYNKKVLKKITSSLDKAKKPAVPKDIIVDPKGQWNHPGEVTRIPASNITMQGVNYPVLGVGSNGQQQMMYPGMEYTFPGADYVDEYPQMKKGGLKKNKTSRSLMATNKLFAKNFLFKKPGKNTIYDPKSNNYQDGGEYIEAELTDEEIEEYKKGGYIVDDISVPQLDKAQLGKNTSLTMSPYSLNASGIQLASKKFDEYNPELLVGVKQTLKSPGKQYKHNASLDVGLPYEGKFVPSVKANYHGAYTGSSKAGSAFFPSVHSDLQAGYTPNQGFNVGMTANPRVEFGNKSQDVYLKQNWPQGAWKGYTGITGGAGYRAKGFNKDVGIGDIGAQAQANKMAGRAHIGYGLNAGFETRPFRNTPLRMGVDASVTSSLMKAAGEQQDIESGKFAAGTTPMIKANLIYPIVQNTVKKQDKAEQQRKIDEEVFKKADDVIKQPTDNEPQNSDGERVKRERKKRDYEPVSFDGERPVGYLPGYNPETGEQVGEGYTRKAYGFNQGPTMYKKGGYLPEVQNTESIETELTDEEIQAYIDAGYYIEELD
jgi:hypothetical protein